jgi:hypothetical protein
VTNLNGGFSERDQRGTKKGFVRVYLEYVKKGIR